MIDRTDAGDAPAGDPEVFYYLQDILGSTVAMTDSAGSVVERYAYEPYGETIITDASGDRIEDSTVGNPFMRTGQRFEQETGLYHFYERTYSLALGRWLQRDPLGYVDGMNLYQYVSSSPMVYVDPLGLVLGYVPKPGERLIPAGSAGDSGGGGGDCANNNGNGEGDYGGEDADVAADGDGSSGGSSSSGGDSSSGSSSSISSSTNGGDSEASNPVDATSGQQYIWIPSDGADQDFNVGNPNGNYVSYSFGLDGSRWNIVVPLHKGAIYKTSTGNGTPISDEYIAPVTPDQSDQIRRGLKRWVGHRMVYGLTYGNCRTWCRNMFEDLVEGLELETVDSRNQRANQNQGCKQ